MLHNIKALSLHRVFHGIRFKVNEDWESGKIPFFILIHSIQSSDLEVKILPKKDRLK